MVENTWNVSVRLMLDVPRETHRYLVEPLSNTAHIKQVLIKRFLSFLDQIRKSDKTATKFLLETIHQDARSTTGSNLRNILLLTKKTDVHQLVPNDALDIPYHPISSVEEWRVPFIKELIDAKNDQLNILNIVGDDLDEMLTALCTS